MKINPSPSVAVVISTYDRSQYIEQAVTSILANEYDSFDLYVVDQGPGYGVDDLLAKFKEDNRYHYIQSRSTGAASGRNLGVKASTADLIVFTDDDCIVPRNWLSTAVQPFLQNENLALLFGRVEAGDHDPQQGFIPTFDCSEPRLIRSVRHKNRMRGIAATAAVRRSVFLEVHGFDEMLGPGAPFHSNEEGDLTVRILLKGYDVLALPDFHVTHHGFRTFREGRQLAWHNWFGIGGAYAKYLKIGAWSAIHIFFWEFFLGALMQVIENTFIKRRPGGITPIIAYLAGTLKCFMTPIDHNSLLFIASDDLPTTRRNSRFQKNEPDRGNSQLPEETT